MYVCVSNYCEPAQCCSPKTVQIRAELLLYLYSDYAPPELFSLLPSGTVHS